ncbi:unnamed protein product [Clonostachys byssicola]|uniref:Uncharacterized protein n=1 Tax=Clonostachys byssicola TaxID=160290 RepID=A0A9N9U0C5_9HYPO|nr:unnamed protein product [Clonostachys byssicola]
MSHWVIMVVGLVAMIAPTTQSRSTSDPTSISLPVRFPLNLSRVAASVVAVESGQTTVVSFECQPGVTATEVCDPDVDRRITLGPPVPGEPSALEAAIYRGGWVTWREDRWCRLDSGVTCGEDLTTGSTGAQSIVSPILTQEGGDFELRGPAASSAEAQTTTSGVSSTFSPEASPMSPGSNVGAETTEPRMSILLATGSPVIPTVALTTSGSGNTAGLLREGHSLGFAVVAAGMGCAALILLENLEGIIRVMVGRTTGCVCESRLF